MRTIITVIGKDKVGIIAGVTHILAEASVNVLDISQTIMKDFFTMIMVTELPYENYDLKTLGQKLDDFGATMALDIRVQHEAIFESMHRL